MLPRHTCGAAGILVFAALAGAQTLSSGITYNQTSTSGMVGLTLNQTARLNVLNVNYATLSGLLTGSRTCSVELKFLDGSGKQLKSSTVSNLAQGSSASLDLMRSEIAGQSGSRAEVRGVVVANPTPPTASACGVVANLEVFDNTTGSTASLTSDFRPAPVLGVIPLRVASQAAISPTVLPFQLSSTSGMAGLTANQTARLNVLNLNPTPASTTTTAANCTVELEFFDAQNNLLKQTLLSHFAPQTAASLDLTRPEVTGVSATRAEIRGVVIVNPASTPLASPVAPGYCSVLSTLEVFDVGGSTVELTSDFRAGNPLTAAVSGLP